MMGRAVPGKPLPVTPPVSTLNQSCPRAVREARHARLCGDGGGPGGLGLAAGCFEGKADMTFNPDGTGKMVGEITFPMEPPWAPPQKTGDDLKTPEEQMKAVVTNIVKKSTGIDAWKDVSFEQVPGNRVHFKGTAYFKEASKVKFFPDARPRVGYGGEGPDANMLILTRAAEKRRGEDPLQGHDRRRGHQGHEGCARPVPETAAGVRGPTQGPEVRRYVFRVPGVIGEVHGFKTQDNALAASVDGNRILHAIDALLDDNAYLKEFLARERARSAPSGPPTRSASASTSTRARSGPRWANPCGRNSITRPSPRPPRRPAPR